MNRVHLPVSRSLLAAAVAPLLLIGCSAPSGRASPGPASPGTSGDPADAAVVEIAATEYAFDPSTVTVPAGEVTFRVTNTGQEEHEFEIFAGETVVDEVEGLVPGLSRDLTVTLEPGAYTYVCKIADHEARGMTGTLTVE